MIEIKDFINFSLQRLFPTPSLVKDDALIKTAFEETYRDNFYHFPEMTRKAVKDEILRNGPGLPVFLYRLANMMHRQGYEDTPKFQIHFLMKTLCGCEIYWSTPIGEGFHIEHALGTVIGSRCKIGKGFSIYQGCTVGHKDLKCKTDGPRIGNDVTLCSNSQILGNITIGDHVTIGANSLVIDNIETGLVVAGNPVKPIKI